MKKLMYGLVISVLMTSPSWVAAKDATAVQMTSQQELIDLFLSAAKIGQTEVLEEFLKHGFPVNVQNKSGYTALMMATYYGQEKAVDILLKNGADRCLRDHRGNTALMGAMFKLEWGIAKQLRQIDCDAQAKQTGQKTTAEFAKIIGQEQKLQQLIESMPAQPK